MNTSAYPSFFSPLGAALALAFLPITALVWAEKCSARKSHDGSTFLLYATIGIILSLIAATQIARFLLDLPSWPFAACLALTTYPIVSIFNIGLIVKVELEWRIRQ